MTGSVKTDNEQQAPSYRGGLMIFSAPSGAGKSTVVKHLMKKFPYLGFSVSATSRDPRLGERDGVEYFFLNNEEFKRKVANGEFVEYQEVYPGLYYGTLKSEVERLRANGKIVVFDIDVKGGVNLKKIYGNEAFSVFIMPPSVDELKKRLLERGADTPDSIEKRVAKARQEIEYSDRFDYILINNKLEDCLKEAETITGNFYSSLL